jgi:ribose transport system ATP-binding protein
MPDSPLLNVVGAFKRFGATQALNGLDFEVGEGEIHALLGANGAGKSTLIKVLAGVYSLDRGSIQVLGNEISPAVAPANVAFIHQDLGLVESMSVAENIGLVAGFVRPRRLISWRRTRVQAARVIDLLGQDIDPRAPIAELSAAQKSIVAIARALALPDTRLLILDEPTASLAEREVERVFESLRALRETGVGMIYVSHRLDEVFRIADRVTVMRDGRRVSVRPVAAADRAVLVNEIVGRQPIKVVAQAKKSSTDTARLTLEKLVGPRVGPVSLEIAAGEILALVGLEGAGQATVGRMLIGDEPTHGGRILIDGEELNLRGPRSAIASGIGFVSSKRTAESIAENLSVRENFFLNPTIAEPQRRWLSPRGERAQAQILVGKFDVRTAGTEMPISTLSGGNQQKVILARWLAGDRKLLVLEEPTIGVDVGAKADIYNLLNTAADAGVAVLLISVDFEEVTSVASRALAFSNGQIVAELSRSEISVDGLTHAAMSGTKEVLADVS